LSGRRQPWQPSGESMLRSGSAQCYATMTTDIFKGASHLKKSGAKATPALGKRGDK
jgi:hypothetical protein